MTNSKLVYSTDGSSKCLKCGKILKKCSCSDKQAALPSDGIVRISRQTKGRKGSGVTIITGIPLTSIELKKLSKQLKQKCGSGGTVKNDTIEIQGDHRDTILTELQKNGWTVKKAGG